MSVFVAWPKIVTELFACLCHLLFEPFLDPINLVKTSGGSSCQIFGTLLLVMFLKSLFKKTYFETKNQ